MLKLILIGAPSEEHYGYRKLLEKIKILGSNCLIVYREDHMSRERSEVLTNRLFIHLCRIGATDVRFMGGRPSPNRHSQRRFGMEALHLILDPYRDAGEKLKRVNGLPNSRSHRRRKPSRIVIHIDCDLVGKGRLPTRLDVMKFGLGMNLSGFFRLENEKSKCSEWSCVSALIDVARVKDGVIPAKRILGVARDPRIRINCKAAEESVDDISNPIHEWFCERKGHLHVDL
jgi:hypothetical protein